MKLKSAKSLSLRPRFRVMRGKEIAFGPGQGGIAALVNETGSIGEAAKRMDMSYMRAWSLIQTMNACFKEPLIAAVRGGHKRGGAELTESGHAVLKLYQQMEKAGLRASASSWKRLQKLLRD
ncbi:MAG: hypothetical protein WDM76_02645 [Limisphaerales bacterium]